MTAAGIDKTYNNRLAAGKFFKLKGFAILVYKRVVADFFSDGIVG